MIMDVLQDVQLHKNKDVFTTPLSSKQTILLTSCDFRDEWIGVMRDNKPGGDQAAEPVSWGTSVHILQTSSAGLCQVCQ